MSYIGEDDHFSYRDGKCELHNKNISPSAAAAFLGRKLALKYRRFCAGCCNYDKVHLLYAVCSGIAESGKDVYVCENTDLPSLLFSRPIMSVDCAVYLHGDSGSLIISLFDRNSLPFSDKALGELLECSDRECSVKYGKMLPVTSFSSILAHNITDSLDIKGLIPAGVSCGNSVLRSLWLKFFSGSSDELAFQVSDDGQRVNAYSLKYGFISHEKLRMCCILKLLKEKTPVYLPDDFNYSADILGSSEIIRFSRDAVPPEAGSRRFLSDPLYMCVSLAKDMKNFFSLIEELPAFASSKREISISNMDRMPIGKTFSDQSGKIFITRSGRNRITLAVQSYSAEAAAELCCLWTEKFRRLDKCGTFE